MGSSSASPPSRRQLLLGSLSAALIPGLIRTSALDVQAAESGSGSESDELTPLPTQKGVDVAVVGAGFAGCAAAARLSAAGKSVAVVEARDRIGGRTWTQEVLPGLHLDVGGQWIGPTQLRINRLVQQLGVKTFPTFNEGRSTLDHAGRLSTYAGTIPHVAPRALVQLNQQLKRMDRLARTVPLDCPWKAPEAAKLDSVSTEAWLKWKTHSSTAYELLRVGLQMVLPAELNRISLLHTLWFIHSAGGLDALLNVQGGAQQDRFEHGTLSLLDPFCRPFQASIHLQAPVRSIRQDQSGVTLVTDRGTFSARRVIVAVPPTLAGRIDYQPLLSTERDQLTQTVPMGTVMKCMAFYERPWWRTKGSTGQAVATGGPIAATFDNSHPGFPNGILLGFAVGLQAVRLAALSPEERKKQVLQAFARFFGDEALSCIHYLDHAWAEEAWSRGCYLGFMPPGVWTSFGVALRRPEGRIHWAGTETALEWSGYLEGALESGERAAGEVLEALQG